MRGTAGAAGAAAAAAALLLAGCGSDAAGSDASGSDDPGSKSGSAALSAAPSTTPAVQPGLSARSVYGRHAAVRGKVDVRIANRGPRELQVRRLQVRHPMFAQVPAYDRETPLPADGRERIVPVPFGAARCDVTGAGGAVVVLTLPDREVAVPLRDGSPGLVRAHDMACAADAVTDAAVVELSDWTRDGDRVRADLRLRRTAAGRVVVTQVEGSVLFDIETAGTPALVLEDGDDEASTEVVARATRCDPHARIESKRSFTFPVRTALGRGEPVPLPVTASDAGRAVLQALLEDTCGAGGSATGPA